jgi:hypothetical protein
MAISLLKETTRITVLDSDLEDVDNGDTGTSYTVRQIPPDVNREIAKKHTKYTPNSRTHRRDEDVDNVGFMDDLIDYALMDWSGILDDGAPAPCTRENKLLLDMPRKIALLKVAGLNRVAAEVRAQSFRPPASVL